MDDGEAVCFIAKKIKPFLVTSMNAQRHPQLQERLERTPPERVRISPTAESQPEKSSAQKPPPLSAWHFDPQLFRKWSQYDTAERGVGEHAQGADQMHEVSLGL